MSNEENNFISEQQIMSTSVPDEECLPHLHVVTYRKNYTLHNLRELPLKNISDSYISEHSEDIKSGYAKCVAFLRLFMGGDRHTAEYLLLGLISSVYKRENGLLIGDLNLNVSGLTPARARLICEFVQAVNPLVCRFDASVESLSETRFIPRKNYDTN